MIICPFFSISEHISDQNLALWDFCKNSNFFGWFFSSFFDFRSFFLLVVPRWFVFFQFFWCCIFFGNFPPCLGFFFSIKKRSYARAARARARPSWPLRRSFFNLWFLTFFSLFFQYFKFDLACDRQNVADLTKSIFPAHFGLPFLAFSRAFFDYHSSFLLILIFSSRRSDSGRSREYSSGSGNYFCSAFSWGSISCFFSRDERLSWVVPAHFDFLILFSWWSVFFSTCSMLWSVSTARQRRWFFFI